MHNENNYLRPVVVLMSLTSACNLRCLHCSVQAGHARCGELVEQEWCRVLSEVAECGIRAVALFGGEPLLRADLVLKLLHYGNDLGLAMTLCTNGTLLHESLADKIAEANPAWMLVSLDGAYAHTHDRFRGSKSFCDVLNGITLAQERRIQVGVSSTISRNNQFEVVEIINSAHDLGASMQVMYRFSPCGMGATYGSLALSDFEWRQILIEQIEPLLRPMWMEGYMLRYEPTFLRRNNAISTLDSTELVTCQAKKRPRILIDSTGTIFPCVLTTHEKHAIGNIRQTGLKSILESAALNSPLQCTALGKYSQCVTCMGGCALLQNGIDGTCDPRCTDDLMPICPMETLPGWDTTFELQDNDCVLPSAIL